MPYDAYNAYLSIAPSTSKSYYQEQLQELIDYQFDNASDYYTVQKKDRLTGLWSNLGVRLTKPYEVKNMTTIRDDYYKVIFSNTDIDVYLGDMFEFNNYRYMAVDIGRTNSPTNSCLIQRCNVRLKFYSTNVSVMPSTPVGNTLYIIDGILTNKLANPSEDRLIMLPDDQAWVEIPNSEEARLINWTDKGGTRFLIGNPIECWNCIAFDSIADNRPTIEEVPNILNGTINIKLKKSQINTITDNLVLSIARQSCYT